MKTPAEASAIAVQSWEASVVLIAGWWTAQTLLFLQLFQGTPDER